MTVIVHKLIIIVYLLTGSESYVAGPFDDETECREASVKVTMNLIGNGALGVYTDCFTEEEKAI